MKTLPFFLLVALFSFHFRPSLIAQNRIIINPSFESGSIIPHGSLAYPESEVGDVPQIDGWYSTHPLYNGAEGPIEHWRSGTYSVSSQDGGYHVELNLSQTSRLYQLVYLDSGETIAYEYYHRKRQFETQTVELSVYSQDGSTKIQVLNTHSASSQISWDQVSGNTTFNGSSGIYQISFEAIAPASGGVGNFLDNVSIGLKGLTEFTSDSIRSSESNSAFDPHILVNGEVLTAATVSFSLNPASTAIEGVDFNFPSKSLNVAAGAYGIADSIPIGLSLINDDLSQGSRTIVIDISAVAGDLDSLDANGDGYQGSLTITITDDDPSPSGPGPLPGLWYKADAGVTASSNFIWANQGTITNADAMQSSTSQQPSLVTTGIDQINFNPIIEFDGFDDRLTTPNLNGVIGVFGNNENCTQFAVFRKVGRYIYSSLDSTTAWKIGMATDDINSIQSVYQSGFDVSTSNTFANFETGLIDMVGSKSSVGGSTFDLEVNGIGGQFVFPSASPIPGDYPLDFAYNNGVYSRANIAEVIIYPTLLSTTERLKVQSYLALKYGISLGDNIANVNYMASDGTLIWDASAQASRYNKDIFGIGLDQGSGLDQKESNSMNTGEGNGAGRLGLGNVVVSNPTDLDDGEFLIIGNNADPLIELAPGVKLPADLSDYSRLDRQWWIQKTGDVGTVDISFDLNGIFYFGNDESDFRLLVDNDGDGDLSTGKPTIYQPNPFSMFGFQGVLRFNSVNLPDDQAVAIITQGPFLGDTTKRMWMEASNGVSYDASNVVTNWADQIGHNSFTVSGSPSYVPNEINFNPVVSFSNTDGKASLPTNRLDGDQLITVREAFAVYKHDDTTSRGTPIGSSNLGPYSTNYSQAIFGANDDQRVYVGNGASFARQSYTNSRFDSIYTINNLEWDIPIAPFASGRLNGLPQTITAGSGGGFDSLLIQPMIGGTFNSNFVGTGWFPFNGSLAEVICFPTSLSISDKLKVESYLAIKYGITLDASVSNYLSSAGAVVYDHTAYWNDIFGIGKDDSLGLDQSQSNSMNSGSGNGTGRSGKGNIILSNPSSLDAGDYLLVGHNNDSLGDKLSEIPTALQTSCRRRVAREWKLKRTNDVGTVDLSFDINGIGFSGTPSPSANEHGIIIDTDGDGDFNTGTVNFKAATALNSGRIEIKDLMLTDGAVFTFYLGIDNIDRDTLRIASCGDYTWTNTGRTYDLPGYYSDTLVNAFGCDSIVTLDLSLDLIISSAVVSDSLVCNGDADGQAIARVVGGASPYNYSWNTGETAALETNLTAGTYYVTVTDNNGCTDSTSVILDQPVALAVSTVVDSNVICNGGIGGEIIASPVGGIANYTYLWSNSSTTASITALSAGTYTVTLSDANSCTAVDSAAVTEPPALNLSVVIDSNISCFGSTDGGLTANASGGSSPYIYSWSNSATTPSINSLAAGTYAVTLTDNNGCIATSSAAISEPTFLSAIITSQSNINCNGNSTGSATVAGSGGTAPYAYLWSNAVTTATNTSLAAGIYTVTITDNNGCTATTSTNIIEPLPLSGIITSQSNINCNGSSTGSATVTGSGGTAPYAYLWSNAVTTATNTSLAAGTYAVTITDNNGCTATTSANIVAPITLNANITSQTNVDCNGNANGSATVSGSGGTLPYTYLWSNSSTTASVAALAAGTYSVTITDNNGCTATTLTNITEPTALSASITSQTNVNCNGNSTGSARVGGSGGTFPYTYQWSNSASSESISSLSAGTYTVTLTDNNGCTAIASANITEPTALSASISSRTNVDCNGNSTGSATVTASGGSLPYTYLWSNVANTASINSLAAGTYTVTLTDNNGCTATTSTNIIEPTALIASISVQTNVDCNGGSNGSITVSGSGGTAPFTYLWNNSATSASLSSLNAGTYSVSLTDSNGCTANATGVITEPSPITSTITTIPLSCNSGNNGSASLSVNGGTSPYTYNWSNNDSTATIDSLSSGTYRITITDANGCIKVDSILLNQANPLNATISSTDISCSGQSDGSARVDTVSGGTPPYIYSWSTSDTTAQIFNLSAATYSVTISDNNGCTYLDSVTINASSVLNVTVIIDSNTTCFNNTDGGASTIVSGGTTPYTYDWSNADTTASLSNVGQGVYDLTVTDANGCSTTDQAIINVDDSIPPSIQAKNISVYLDPSGQVFINGLDLDSGSTDNCSIASYRAFPDTFDCSMLGINMVTLSVVDDNGNQSSTSSVVTVMDTLSPTARAKDISVYLNSNREAVADANLADDGSSDNCSIRQFWLSDSTFNCQDNKVNQVRFYVSDSSGNTDSAIIDIRVVDTLGPVNFAITETVCGAYFWNRSGLSYSNSGIYTLYDTLTACDTIYTLDLEVREVEPRVINVGDSLFAFQANANYQWFDCRGDSIVSGVNSRGYRPDTSGFYSLIIDNGICSDTSECQEVMVTGIEGYHLSDTKLKIYPNPTTNDFFFETSSFGENEEMVIYDMKGSIILRKTVDEYREKIETDNWNAGVYFVRFGEEIKKVVITR